MKSMKIVWGLFALALSFSLYQCGDYVCPDGTEVEDESACESSTSSSSSSSSSSGGSCGPSNDTSLIKNFPTGATLAFQTQFDQTDGELEDTNEADFGGTEDWSYLDANEIPQIVSSKAVLANPAERVNQRIIYSTGTNDCGLMDSETVYSAIDFNYTGTLGSNFLVSLAAYESSNPLHSYSGGVIITNSADAKSLVFSKYDFTTNATFIFQSDAMEDTDIVAGGNYQLQLTLTKNSNSGIEYTVSLLSSTGTVIKTISGTDTSSSDAGALGGSETTNTDLILWQDVLTCAGAGTCDKCADLGVDQAAQDTYCVDLVTGLGKEFPDEYTCMDYASTVATCQRPNAVPATAYGIADGFYMGFILTSQDAQSATLSADNFSIYTN